MPPTLGRLVSVPLREVWAHEAKDFTPWLADGENLALLADTLQLGELQFRGTEVAVGNFSIDILARDIEGRMVVIENQFGPTDHTHLGQIMPMSRARMDMRRLSGLPSRSVKNTGRQSTGLMPAPSKVSTSSLLKSRR